MGDCLFGIWIDKPQDKKEQARTAIIATVTIAALVLLLLLPAALTMIIADAALADSAATSTALSAAATTYHSGVQFYARCFRDLKKSLPETSRSL